MYIHVVADLEIITTTDKTEIRQGSKQLPWQGRFVNKTMLVNCLVINGDELMKMNTGPQWDYNKINKGVVNIAIK